ncbi:hypothetical protein LTR15_000914 [Elasticomyces elasticus]|nr:hypothetical protein LTR15_000914 [Elasticomyces elasticus]
MPRRQFIADLQKVQGDSLPPGINDVQQGEDDGQITFEFIGTLPSGLVEPVRITAMVTDLGDYPKSHEYMIFCGDDAPRAIGAALQDVRGTNKKTIFELIDIVSATLTRLAPDRDGDMQMMDSQEVQSEDEDDDDIYGSDHEAFEISANQPTPYAAVTSSTPRATGRPFRARVRSDLLTAKKAGFRVGQLGHLMDGFNAFVTISIRMSKLGISEEAMQAWHVDPKEYLILIIQYPNGYKTNEELQACDSMRLAPNLAMRLCAGKKYKPTLQEAIKAFTVIKKNDRDGTSTSDIPSAEDAAPSQSSLHETFISKPLGGFLQERLVPILRYRSAGMDWRGAEAWFTEISSKGASGADAIPDAFYQPEPTNDALPDIVTADHYTARGLMQYSFPLLAMQFSLRHFVRCTEFCLVCHRKLDTEVEAIKPYVCDQPLCLYQYMTLGFGPSIEHEIMTQPQVVDLLISFCYSSASARKLRDFPDGLALTVPAVDLTEYRAADPYAAMAGYRGRTVADKPDVKKAPSELTKYDVGFDHDRRELIFFNKPDQCPVRQGSWIVLTTQGLEGSETHCRVSEVTYYPTIRIDESVDIAMPGAPISAAAGATVNASGSRPKTITPATTPKWAPASFTIYEQDFEQLDKSGKCISICQLLDTLPPLKCLQEYLTKHRPADLKDWVTRISPAALSLLRWIIASNRACIMQVDADSHGGVHGQERLYGMKDYVQFRFAMGAPDKEQRFITEVRNTTQRLTLKYPTIFAWHGSPLPNWHSIIRQGLHFKNADHGRAYGDGVYHAKDAHTSTSYSGMYGGVAYGSQGIVKGAWANSQLKINSALALNEIVNAPGEFQSQNPYFVVQHLDWIQTRYLFVQCQPTELDAKAMVETKPVNEYPQDPSRTPRGISDTIVIPASAITSRLAATEDRPSVSRGSKRLKGSGGFNNPIAVDDGGDSESDATDAEDLDILFEEDEPTPAPTTIATPTQVVATRPKGTATDFLPGTLDFSTLPIMPEPTYANPAATKRLMKELGSLQKVQEASALGDLGWYIDVDRIENAYQWIVELHSFHVIDPTLPIAKDMKKANIQSIVLEVRYGADFPFTPPYVRVIRPRCLSLGQGGGGHIVLGGAMCMELLTNTGWSSVSSMESVLMQIRLAIASEPHARLDTRTNGDYGAAEGADGYIRACAAHGWTVPPGFKGMAYGMSSKEGGS